MSQWSPLCYFVAIMHLLSQSSYIVFLCGDQLLNVTFIFLSARCLRSPGFSLIRFILSMCHRLYVGAWTLYMLYKVNANMNGSQFGELPSASTRVRHTELLSQLIH